MNRAPMGFPRPNHLLSGVVVGLCIELALAAVVVGLWWLV